MMHEKNKCADTGLNFFADNPFFKVPYLSHTTERQHKALPQMLAVRPPAEMVDAFDVLVRTGEGWRIFAEKRLCRRIGYGIRVQLVIHPVELRHKLRPGVTNRTSLCRQEKRQQQNRSRKHSLKETNVLHISNFFFSLAFLQTVGNYTQSPAVCKTNKHHYLASTSSDRNGKAVRHNINNSSNIKKFRFKFAGKWSLQR